MLAETTNIWVLLFEGHLCRNALEPICPSVQSTIEDRKHVDVLVLFAQNSVDCLSCNRSCEQAVLRCEFC